MSADRPGHPGAHPAQARLGGDARDTGSGVVELSTSGCGGQPFLFAIMSWRWRELPRMQGIGYRRIDALLAVVAGLFLGLVTPGRVGEMGKAFHPKPDLDMPVSEGLANVLTNRLFDLNTILVLGAAGVVWFRLLPDWALALIVTGVMGTLPMPISSRLGTRDAATIALFAPLGLAAEQAVAFSTLFFLTFYVGGGILGAVAWQLKPLEERQ